MVEIIKKLHHSKIVGTVLHTLPYCLQTELEGCSSVLDLGCGPESPLQLCKNVRYSVGVEAFLPYLKQSQKRKIHSKYIYSKIEDVQFDDNSFDAVILIEVLEHLPKRTGLQLIKNAVRWAKKKVIVSTPNGYFPMDIVDNNRYQKHLSGWDISTLEKFGFQCHGVSGLKFFHAKRDQVHSLYQKKVYLTNIRFRPKLLFYIFNAFSQIIAYYLPRHAFGLFAVREK